MSRSVQLRRLLFATLLLAAVSVAAGVTGAGARSDPPSPEVRLGARNPSSGTARGETQIIGSAPTYATRQSNVGEGGAAIYGCRTAAADEPCLRATNLRDGKAFELATRGRLGGTITAGGGGPDARPFTTNATGVATGLNADRLDGREASDFLGAGAKATDADRLDGLDASDFMRAGASIDNADRLDGLDSSQFLRADGVAADSSLLGGQPPSAFLPAAGKAADADELDGLDSADFLRADGVASDSSLLGGQPPSAFLPAGRVAASDGRVDLSVGERAGLLGAGGVSVSVSCVEAGSQPGVQIRVDSDEDDTFTSVFVGGGFANQEVDAAAGAVLVASTDAGSIGSPAIAPVPFSIAKAGGLMLQGHLTIGFGVFGQDCVASGALVSS